MKAVIFDMDGLMFDTERLVQYSWNQAGMAMKKGQSGLEIYNTLGFNRNQRRAYFKKLYGEKFDFETFQILSSFYYYQYTKLHGVPVKKGLYELLDFLKQNNYLIALATSSSSKSARNLLKQAHIEHYFNAIITGDQIHHGKPDPEIYNKACLALGVNPQDGYALEDSYHGLQSAYTCGLKPIFVPDLLTDDTPVKDIIIAKCENLLEVIQYISQH